MHNAWRGKDTPAREVSDFMPDRSRPADAPQGQTGEDHLAIMRSLFQTVTE